MFCLDPYFFAAKRAARLSHRMQHLLGALGALAKNLAHLGAPLHVVAGKSIEAIPRLAREAKVERIVAHRWVEPFGRERDAKVAAAAGVPFVLHEGETLAPPGSIRTQTGGVYAVFTPFSRAFRKAIQVADPLPVPALRPAKVHLDTVPIPTVEDLGLRANPALPVPGERAARDRLAAFVRDHLGAYDTDRDRMDRPGTSRLSQDLKFGTLSIRTAWRAVEAAPASEGRERFLTELLWREFAHHTLWDRPELLERPFRADFEGFPWRDDPSGWKAWCEGTTGYPVVDAAARQLLGEGWVHNRARMISASFLTKHLGIDFRRGEAHYMEHLVDGDWAQNDLGWQWSAGCGCDAQPYFRVFHPVTQGQRFDPDGAYVRRWVPELARLPTRFLHAPWEAPALELRAAGVRLGETYPRPIVDHATARARFLADAKRHLGGPRA